MVTINKAFAIKFFKFGIVGISGMAVDFGITFLLKEKLKVNKYIASTVGFLVAASSNFMLNRVWTFRNTDPDVSLQFAKFLVSCVIGVLLSSSIIYLLNGRLKLNFYFSKLISIGIVVLWNFTVSYFITFRSS
jgi:putative flippase GtrA